MKITNEQEIDTYYAALLARVPGYVGVFFVGVKTTGVFCIATCRARKPKKENVVFYHQFKDALSAGFRPCKICRPTENTHETPEIVKRAIDLTRKSPKEKITDTLLQQHKINPVQIRRWFVKHYGITFHAFQRMLRINIALQELKEGKPATETAFSSGYESLSGFGYTYKKLVGASPQQSLNLNIILIHRFTTPLGPMFVCATDKGICLSEFVDRKMLETEFKDLQRLLNAKIFVGENQFTKQAQTEIEEYFSGERKIFNVAIDAPGTPFQKATWAALQTIQYGKTTSYQDQAKILGNPNAVRAVATANGANRIAIIIPCHRVIGKNGSLMGYGGGLARKRWLLLHEEKYK